MKPESKITISNSSTLYLWLLDDKACNPRDPLALHSYITPFILHFPQIPAVLRRISQSEMQTLQQKASEWSGVQTDDAFAIDDTNLFQKLGLQTFINLSTNFYNRYPICVLSFFWFCARYLLISGWVSLIVWVIWIRVYDDEEEWFRSIFASSNKEDAIHNQYEFFVQRMGGPPLYSQRRGELAYFTILANWLSYWIDCSSVLML